MRQLESKESGRTSADTRSGASIALSDGRNGPSIALSDVAAAPPGGCECSEPPPPPPPDVRWL